MDKLQDWVCLSLLPGLGPAGVQALIDRFVSPGIILQQPVEALAETEAIRARQLAGFGQLEQCREQAGRIVGVMRTLGGRIVPWDSLEYPELLRELPDPPPLLYCLGEVSLMKRCCVAIVGSRSATGYGRRVSASFGERLSASGVTVVSGMALGIDSEAHEGALPGAGTTIAVLGCGLDVVYPRQNEKLFHKIRTNGLLVSEYPPGTRPEGFRFPARNRIIAGLSRAIVVVEAARKSGSLITAQLGLDFGREVFAVPGQVDSCKSEGAHWLIRQGAQLVVSADDILQSMEMAAVFKADVDEDGDDSYAALEPEMRHLLEQLEPYPQLLDEVLVKTQLSAARGSELLLLLELEGFVEMGPGNLVTRVK